MEMSINLIRPERKERTIKIRIKFTPLHQPVIKKEQWWAPMPLPYFLLLLSPSVDQSLEREYLVWGFGAFGYCYPLLSSSLFNGF